MANKSGKFVGIFNVYGETKSAFEARAKDGGYWKDFLRQREAIRKKTLAEFPDMPPAEINRIAWEAQVCWPPNGVEVPEGVECRRRGAFYEKTPRRTIEQIKIDEQLALEEKKNSQPDLLLPEPDPKDYPEPKRKKPGVGIPLYKRDEFTIPDGSVSPRKILEWVVDNVCIEDVQPKDAPSPGAWARLMYARQDYDSLAELMKAWDRLLPSRAEQAKNEGRVDDGRDLLDMVKMVQGSRDKAAGKTEGIQNGKAKRTVQGEVTEDNSGDTAAD